MSVYKVFSLEATNVADTIVTFNAPGTYTPPYGKVAYLLQGQGQPGNPVVPGNYAGTNPPTGSNAEYNPPTDGNIAGYNSSGGNFAGYNPPATLPGSYNPVIPGGYNPGSGGNVAGYTPGNQANLSYTIWDSPQVGSGTNYSCPDPYYLGGEGSGDVYFYCTPVYNYNPPTAYYNPYTPGNLNPSSGGNLNYYTQPGNAYYNPYYAGNAYYNIVPGNLYYNPPSTPGTPYYNPSTPGNPGPSNTVFGVTLPGGLGGENAAIVGYTPITIGYSNSPVPVTVPTGGYVKIQSTNS